MQFIEVIKLINEIRRDSADDKIVVVSQWTSTLDLLSKYLNQDRVCFTELTGKTAIAARMDIVKKFNLPNDQNKVFLINIL